MVRKHNYARQADRAWARLTAAAPPGSIPEGGTDAGSDQAMDGPDHPPHFGTHSHLHFAYGHHTGDAAGLHTHSHHHGFTGDNGAEWDNDHDHDHSESDFGVHGQPDANPYEPQSRYGKHVRFSKGGMQVINALPERARRAGSAYAALYDRKAPGAAISGTQGSLGQLVQAMFRAASGTGPPIVNSGGLSERVPSEGGALLGENLRSDVMLHTLEQEIIRPRATVIPMREQAERVPVLEEGSDTSGSVFGGLNFTWTEEQATLTASVASYGLDVLRAKKIIAYMVCPNELFADADKLSTFLNDVIPAGLAFAEDAAFIAGSGTLGGTTLGASQPQGILNADCAIAVTRQTSSAVTIQDVYKMTTRMLPRSMGNFIWICSPDVLAQLLEISLNVSSATSGIVPPPLWLDFDPVQGCWTLLKRPLFASEHASALGTEGDLIAADPRYYLVGDYEELTIEVAVEGPDFIRDESDIRIRARLEGRPVLASAVTPANSSETVSPFVLLK